MKDFFTDDKNMVICAVIVLGLALIVAQQMTPEVTTSIFSGLFGIAVGKSMK